MPSNALRVRTTSRARWAGTLALTLSARYQLDQRRSSSQGMASDDDIHSQHIEIPLQDTDTEYGWYWDEDGGAFVVDFGCYSGKRLRDVSFRWLEWSHQLREDGAFAVRLIMPCSHVVSD